MIAAEEILVHEYHVAGGVVFDFLTKAPSVQVVKKVERDKQSVRTSWMDNKIWTWANQDKHGNKSIESCTRAYQTQQSTKHIIVTLERYK